MKKIALLLAAVGLVLGFAAPPAAAGPVGDVWYKTVGCGGLNWICPGPMP